jgi:hypothetical protein
MAENLSTLSADGLKGTPTGSGARYTLMSTWESSQQGDLVTAGDNEVLECYGDDYGGADGALVNNVNIAGWTTSASNNITVRAAAGEGHGGVQRRDGGTGFALYSTNNTVLYISVDHTVISGIELSSSGVEFPAIDLTGNTVYIHSCIVWTENISGSQKCINMNQGGSVYDIRNCVIMQTAGWAFDTRNSVSATVDSCTIISDGTGGNGAVGGDLRNCVSYGYAGACITAVNSQSYCATEDNTASGTGAVTGVLAGDFTNLSLRQFTPATDGKLDGTGTDLSGTFTDDIAGNTRSVPWEIGAYEIVAAGGTFDENGEGTVASRFSVT